MATTATPATGTAAIGTKGRFVWHELMTSDPTAAQAFYKEVIGWGTMPMTVPGGEGGPLAQGRANRSREAGAEALVLAANQRYPRSS